MKRIIAKHEQTWRQPGFKSSVFFGVLFFFASLAANYYAGRFADRSASSGVTDLILNVLPRENVDFLFIYGFAAFLIFVVVLVILEPKRTPFMLKSLALLIAVRSFFVILTHLAPQSAVPAAYMGAVASRLTFSADLFFSAHTAIPFLLALVFWRHKILRWAFVGFSLFFGFVVLLGHLHYSIDVFAAYFITYTVFCIAKKIFPADSKRFDAIV